MELVKVLTTRLTIMPWLLPRLHICTVRTHTTHHTYLVPIQVFLVLPQLTTTLNTQPLSRNVAPLPLTESDCSSRSRTPAASSNSFRVIYTCTTRQQQEKRVMAAYLDTCVWLSLLNIISNVIQWKLSMKDTLNKGHLSNEARSAVPTTWSCVQIYIPLN